MTFLLRAEGLFQAKTNCAPSRRRGLLWTPCRQGSPVERSKSSQAAPYWFHFPLHWPTWREADQQCLPFPKGQSYVIGQGRCIMRGKRYSSHVASCSFPGREPVPRRYIHVCPYGSESAGSSLKGRHESALWILKPAVYGHAA